ncbi:MAG TPA: SCO family protein [Vicinamibacterales bacterium]|jgi:cytochrome oxidase Cu insertion factor (SCO1/SenC/PrrC family)|nr:SCO family protein [Vicinamibacterales bacterium]
MTTEQRAWSALAALGAIVTITASWWSLALWPVGPSTPAWFIQTRAVCFGTMLNDLPNAGGWLLLVGQPVGMLIVLATVWTTELRAGFTLAMRRVSGQVIVGLVAAAIVAGLAGVVVRVSGSDDRPFSAGSDRDIATALTRVNDEAPAFSLVDQNGQQISLDRFRGRPVIVTFAYAHCETICPLVVADVLTAQRQSGDRAPAVLVVTLDPWRDTPSRLLAMASDWKLGSEAHVLSGSPEAVQRALNAWRVPRVRNEKTGDLSHPPIVYIVGPDGRIAYVVQGNATAIVAAVRSL